MAMFCPPLTEDTIALVSPGEDPPPLSLRHLAPGFMLENEVSGRQCLWEL